MCSVNRQHNCCDDYDDYDHDADAADGDSLIRFISELLHAK